MTKEESYLKKYHSTLWLGMKHHKTHKDEMLDFVNHSYLKKIYMDNEEKIVMKSTQCGLTEYLTTLAMDLALQGKSIFYVLPTKDLVGRFVQNRIDRSIAFSDFYTAQIKESHIKKSESMSLKHVGKGTIAFVGSNTPKVFTEFPADIVINDEKDQCHQGNLAMAWERMSASEDRRQFAISNPTVLGYGIHKDWISSTQNEWRTKCECGNWIDFDFFKQVVRDEGQGNYVILDKEWEWESGRDISMVCEKCGRLIDSKGAGQWVQQKEQGIRGYHISKLFSTNVTIKEMVDRFSDGLVNDEIMQRFYNADLGKPYTASGSKLTTEDLDRCISDQPFDYSGNSCVIGIDVGSFMHIRINEIMHDGRLKAVYIGSVKDEDDLAELWIRYKIVSGVIDAQPEQRMSERLCMQHKGLFRCYYGEVKKDTIDANQKVLTVRRTSALDNVKEAILTQKILLPINAKSIPEYYDHMTSSTRIYDVKANAGKGAYKWVETSADHLFHAEGYALIARNLLVAMAGS